MMTITLPFIHLLSIFALISSTGLAQDIYQDEINTISSLLHQYLVSVGRNASIPQPRMGLEGAIDPLMAVAPLRYVHDGDLLKLRLLLTNVTLEGISSMTVQEVTFNLAGITTTPVRVSSSSAPAKGGQEGTRKNPLDPLDPSSYDFLPELKSREPLVSSDKEVEYDYYDDNDVDDYEVNTGSAYDDANEAEDNVDIDVDDDDDDSGTGMGMDDDEDYSYQGDEPIRNHRHKGDHRKRSKEASEMGAKHDRNRRTKKHSSTKHKPTKHAPKRSHSQSNKGRSHDKKIRNRDSKMADQSSLFDKPKTFDEQFLKDYDDIIGKSRLVRQKRSNRHHYRKEQEDARGATRHSKKVQLDWSLKPDGDNADDEFASYQQDQELHALDYDTLLTTKSPHHPDSGPVGKIHKPYFEPEEVPVSSPLKPSNDKSNTITRFIALGSNVRVAFRNLRIRAQYVVKGKAGGVFTFKEQGTLVLTIPNAFLTSKFNLTLIPDFNGFRHWRSSRRNHVRVQKVRSRLSLETPKLELTPVSRPTEWVRRQLQEKMDELGKGVGRRDGAVRLLLRNWARLLRRLVTKAAKQPTEP